MNSFQRVMAASRFEASDRVPVIAHVFGHAATLAGVRLEDYLHDAEVLARCQLAALRHYGYDAVFAFVDACVEVEAAGAALRFLDEHRYPFCVRPCCAVDTDFTRRPLPDPMLDGRMPVQLAAAGRLRAAVGDEVLVTGCVQGPMTLALQLLGAETAMFFAADHPERFERVLDYTTAVAIRFGLAQIEAGVHLPLVFEPGGSPALVPASFFREFLLPRIGRIFDAFTAAGAVGRWLHIAGPVQPILPLYGDIGVSIANLDYYVSPAEMAELAPGICAAGSVRPMAFVLDSPTEIFAEATNLIGAYRKRGGFILSSGCEIPPEANPACIEALMAAAKQAAASGGGGDAQA